MVKSDRTGGGGSVPPPTALSRTATAPVSSSVKSAQAQQALAQQATTTPYGPVSRVSTNADAFSASASGGGSSSSSGGRVINCRVTFLDDTHAIFRVPIKAKGGVLLKQVFKHLRVLEPEYFGLQYRDAGEVHYWVDSEKPLNRLPGLTIPTSDVPANFVFCVKFYSSDPAYLEDEFTRYLFVLQIRRDLALGQLVCQTHTAALLAAYVVQAEEGDFNRDNYRDYTYLLKYRFHPAQDVNMLRMIMENHVELQGQNPAEADLNYLEIARRCEMYGIRLHDATDHEGVALQLAVSHLGVNVFQAFQKVNLFSWAKIRKLSFKRRKFLIKLHPETYQGYYKDTVEFLFDSRNACKSFWKQCIEHHVFFRGRTNEQNITRSRSSRMFQYGSHFRFTGRTQRQVVECMKETLTKRSASASATPNRAHNMYSAATRQASVGGGGGHTLPSSKSYTATLTATPLLPIAQMRRPMTNRFNTTGGSRIDRHRNGNGSVNGRDGVGKTAAASGDAAATEVKPFNIDLAQQQQRPVDMKPSTSTSTFSPTKHTTQVEPVETRAVPPTAQSTTGSTSSDRSQTLPRAASVRAAGLGENEPQQVQQTTSQTDVVQTSVNDGEDADKTPTQTRRSSNNTLPQKQTSASVGGSQTDSTTSTLSRKSLKTSQQQQKPPPLSTAINGNNGSSIEHNEDQQQLLPSVDDSDEQQQQIAYSTGNNGQEPFSPPTASDNATPTTATAAKHKATVMRESEFIEEYVMPVPPPPLPTDDHKEEPEEEDSLTGMNMTEEVPYVLYRRKIKWDKFLTYPPPQSQQQGQILLSPDEYEQQQQQNQILHPHHHHHRSAQQLDQQQALLLSQDTAQQHQSPYTTYTRYIDQQHKSAADDEADEDQTRIHYADHHQNHSPPPNGRDGGASVITDVQIEQQRLLPVSMPVLLTSGQHNKPTPQQQRAFTPVQQPSVVKSLSSSRQPHHTDENMASSNEAMLAAMPSTKLRVLDYVAVVNRNRLPPVSMCYSYEDDSVSIDSLQRQLFESVKRKQAARIRDHQHNATPQPQQSSITTPQQAAAVAHEPRRLSLEQVQKSTSAVVGQDQVASQWLGEQKTTRQRSHSTDSVASNTSSASSSASEASYNTTSVEEHDFDDDQKPERRPLRSSRPAKKQSKSPRTHQQPQPQLYVAPKHKLQQNQSGMPADEHFAYADESATTVTDTTNNNQLLNTSATTPQGSNSSDDQYYKAIRQRTIQQAAAAGPVGRVPYYYGINPDDLVVPPPPPPPPVLADNKDEYLYNYDDDPARAYLLAQQQRRSRSLNAPRTTAAAADETSPPPVNSVHISTTDDMVAAAALMAAQQQRRPSYDLAVTAGRMLANGGHGAAHVTPSTAAHVESSTGPTSSSKSRTRVAGSRASAIGAVVADSRTTPGDRSQQPLNAMSTTLHVYPTFDDGNGAVRTTTNGNGRRPSQEQFATHQQNQPPAIANNYRQFQQQYYDAILLPPRPPAAGTKTYSSSSTSHTGGGAGGNSAHNDFSESELNAFVEMSYQDLQTTVRDYSLSSDRFTSSEGISTASSPSGINSPNVNHRRGDNFIYPSSSSRHHQHHDLPHHHQRQQNTAQYHHHQLQPEQHSYHHSAPPSGSHAVQKHHPKTHQPPPLQPHQIVITTTTTTDETSTSPHRTSRTAGSGRRPQSTDKLRHNYRETSNQQRPNAADTTTTSHTEASTTATGSSSCSSSSYTSSSPSSSACSTTSSARRRTADDGSSPSTNNKQQQQMLENAVVPNLKLDTVLIPPTVQKQSSTNQPDSKRAEESKKVSKLTAKPAMIPPPPPVQHQAADLREEQSFSPPPPPLPELSNAPFDTSYTEKGGTTAGSSSYMDEWRAKMRELEQLTGVTSPTSSSSSSTGTGVDQASLTNEFRDYDEHHHHAPEHEVHFAREEVEQQSMPIIPPPAEFGNNLLVETEGETDRRSLSEVHGASGVSYGTTGGRLFELSTPRPVTAHPSPPLTAEQQQAFRAGHGGVNKMDRDDLTYASRL